MLGGLKRVGLLKLQSAFRTSLLHRDYDCVITGDDEVDCEAAHLVPKTRDDVRSSPSPFADLRYIAVYSVSRCSLAHRCTMSHLGYFCRAFYITVMIA